MEAIPKILAIIPARGGSKGVKRKNIRPLAGRPLIQWTIDEAKKSKGINRIIVSTEDEEIAKICEGLGVEVMERPDELAKDDTSSMEVVLYVLKELLIEGYSPDFTVLLQCTSPLRKVQHIDEAINKLLFNIDKSQSIVSVTKEEHPPWWLNKIDQDGYLESFLADEGNKYTRRQDFPAVYRLNGAIYIAKTEMLYQKKSFITDKTLSYIMEKRNSIDIDTEEDLLLAELLFNEDR